MLNGTEYNNFATRLSKGRNVNQNEVINGAAIKNANVPSQAYLNKTWNASTISFYNHPKPVEGYLVKYEINNKLLEVLIEKSIKVVGISRIKNFAADFSSSYGKTWGTGCILKAVP